MAKKPNPDIPTSTAAGKKAVAKMQAKPDKKESLIQDITNRYRVTAREARDIVTAVGTKLTVNSQKSIQKYADKNLVTQIKEVGVAAKTGKPGTPSAVKAGRGIGFRKNR
jgi:hypothetical protein